MKENTTDIVFDIEKLCPSGRWIAMYRYSKPIGVVKEVLGKLRAFNPFQKYRVIRIITITKYKLMKGV